MSAVEFASGFGFTAAATRAYWSHCLGGHDPRDGDDSPLRADDLSGLPRPFVVTAAADVLRDEGEAYAELLRSAGVATTPRRYPGTAHGFRRWLRTHAAQRAVGEIGAALRGATRLGRRLRRGGDQFGDQSERNSEQQRAAQTSPTPSSLTAHNQSGVDLGEFNEQAATFSAACSRQPPGRANSMSPRSRRWRSVESPTFPNGGWAGSRPAEPR